jgi:leucyl aminopeptidase
MIELVKTSRPAAARDTLVIVDDTARLRQLDLTRNDRQYLVEQLETDPGLAVCDISGRLVMVHLVKEGNEPAQREKARKAGDAMAGRLNSAKRAEAQIIGLCANGVLTLALAEGASLGSYAFRKYKSDAKGAPTLNKISIIATEVSAKEIDELYDVCDATWTARDLVNEPVSFLNAVQLGAEIRTLAKSAGFKAEVMERSRIEALGMGGLLAVNKGSVDPPTFSVLEWKPKNAGEQEAHGTGGKRCGVRHGWPQPETHAQQHGPDEVRHGRCRRGGLCHLRGREATCPCM